MNRRVEFDGQFVLGEKGVIHLRPTAEYTALVANYMKDRKKNEPVRIKLSDKEEKKSTLQNRFFHPLLQVWLRSGLAPCDTFRTLKLYAKEAFGCGYEIVEICGEKYQYWKSWAEYTVKEASKTIDGLIDEMLTTGVDFDQLLIDWKSFNKKAT